MYFFFFFFFFQAEDGIRDIGVTGVQTCALPISVELLVGQLGVGGGAGVLPAARLLVAHCASLASWWWPLLSGRLVSCSPDRAVPGAAPAAAGAAGTRGGAGSCCPPAGPAARAGVTGPEPAACGFGDRCSAS